MKFYKVFRVEGGKLVSAFMSYESRHRYREGDVTVDRKPIVDGRNPGLMVLFPLEGALNFLYLSRKNSTEAEFVMHEVTPQSVVTLQQMPSFTGGRYNWEEAYTDSLLVGHCTI